MTDKLFIACITFFTLDLIFVGLTCYHVVKHIKKISEHLNSVRIDSIVVTDSIRSIRDSICEVVRNTTPTKDNRNFIEKGV